LNVLALIPAYTHIDWRLADSLRRVGMPYLHVHNCSDLVRARSRLICDGMRTEAERFLLIDADTAATPDDIVRLAQSDRVSIDSAVAGCYLTRKGKVAAVPLEPVEASVGGDPRFVELLLAGMGFAAISRASLEQLDLMVEPVTDYDGHEWRPYCLPFVLEYDSPNGKAREYVPEDYSFWWRLRTLANTRLWLDTHLPVGHVKSEILTPQGLLDFGLKPQPS
jgi:hypothetical protein